MIFGFSLGALVSISSGRRSDSDYMLILSSDARPFDKWWIQNMNADFLRIRYQNLASSVDDNSGEISLNRADKTKDNQLWRVFRAD